MGRQDRSLRNRKIQIKIDVSDAWKDYLEMTQSLMGVYYEWAEEMAWAKLQKRLKAINRRFKTLLSEIEALSQERSHS